jgi:adenine deaminase
MTTKQEEDLEPAPSGRDEELGPDGDKLHPPEAAPHQGSNDSERTTMTKKKRWLWFLGILLWVLLVLAIVLGVVYGTKDDDETTTVSRRIYDIHDCKIFPGKVVMTKGRIADIIKDPSVDTDRYILPGFVDSHVHIESSLLVPSEFARLAAPHGTVATVSDPHEIANVLGLEGISFMLDNAEKVPFYFFFGAPSCVPATPFETAGAEITVDDIKELFKDDRIKMLSELMNWPGVLFDEPVVLEKIQAAVDADHPVDGHAPGLTGEDAATYIRHGISTDHETYSYDEAIDKLEAGMIIQIREGSASRNYDVLHPIIETYPDQVMFCTDDAHPDLLAQSEIDFHVRRSVELGYNVCDVLKIASKNPVDHYKLPVGLLRKGDSADFVVVDNLVDFHVLETWTNGSLVASDGKALFEHVEVTPINNFGA